MISIPACKKGAGKEEAAEFQKAKARGNEHIHLRGHGLTKKTKQGGGEEGEIYLEDHEAKSKEVNRYIRIFGDMEYKNRGRKGLLAHGGEVVFSTLGHLPFRDLRTGR